MSYVHRTTALWLWKGKAGLSLLKSPLKLGKFQFSKSFPEVTVLKEAPLDSIGTNCGKNVQQTLRDIADPRPGVGKAFQNTLHFKVNDSTILFYKPKQQIVTFCAVPSETILPSAEVIDHLADARISVNDIVFLINGRPKSKAPVSVGASVDENTSTVPLNLTTPVPTVSKLVGTNLVAPNDLDWHEQAIQLKNLPKYYMKLSKIRLTALVVLTEIAGYAMAPEVFDPTVFAFAAVGTTFLSSAANTINQFFEVPFDSQMMRTKDRVLVKGLISPLHAATFAVTCSTLGLSLLFFGVNGLTAGLGALNLFLYTLVYTPLKRLSIVNTWLGSVVGAIPPLIGWAACTGSLDTGAILMGGLLYAWQFPHFNALSWNLRGDYSRAGYRMMSVTNPDLCKRTSLRYSAAILLMCSAAPLVDLTTWMFAIDSVPLNAYLVYLSWRFYRDGDSASSRKLFRFSLIHLPALMILLLISKKHYGSKQAKSIEQSSNVILPT